MCKEDKCVVCFHKFDKPEIFPRDFPKEWKLCCLCRSYAGYIIKYGSVEKYITAWMGVIREDHKETFPEKLRKINRLISLN